MCSCACVVVSVCVASVCVASVCCECAWSGLSVWVVCCECGMLLVCCVCKYAF